MGTVQAQAIMSLDGYVAKQDNTIGRLFDWLQNGEVEIPTPAGDFTVHLSPRERRALAAWTPRWVRWSAGGAVRRRRGLAGPPHPGRARRRRHPPGPDGLGRGAPRRAVHLRHRRGGGRDRPRAGDRRRPRRQRHRGHHRPAVPWSSGCSTRSRSTWCRSSWARATARSSARCRPRTSCSGNPTACVQGDRVTHLVFPSS